MDENVGYSELVAKAQGGDQVSFDHLVRLTEKRLRASIYRLTLEEDLTEEIVQDTIVTMLKVLNELRETERFWPWVLRIAINKLRLHRRTETRRKTVPLSAATSGALAGEGRDAVSDMVGTELREVVSGAMASLKPAYRAVLCLRCYDELGYAEIGELMGCGEFAARMRLCRAKKALKKALLRHGLGKGWVGPALVLFGKMTAPSEAAAAQVSVAASVTKVGLAAGLIGAIGSSTTVIYLAAAGLLSVLAVVASSGPDGTAAMSGQWAGPASGGAVRGGLASTNREYWYFFPEGPYGPMITRSMAGYANGTGCYCRSVQDEQANYFFDEGRNIVHVNNYRQWNEDLSVWRLPTDRAKLTDFLSRVEGEGKELEYVVAKGRGLLLISGQGDDGCYSLTVRHVRATQEEYLRYSWPAGATLMDNRDQMHSRGWTYFRITGHVNDEQVTGSGRVPFVYAASRKHGPWLKLKVGDRLRIVDGRDQAVVYEEGEVVARYAGGSFFSGLSRPWMGLHTIDTVRRDAAEQEVWFETKYSGSEQAATVLLNTGQGELTYTIDMENDLVDRITIATGASKGELTFSYLDRIDGARGEFSEPERKFERKPPDEGMGMLWLFRLLTGSF